MGKILVINGANFFNNRVVKLASSHSEEVQEEVSHALLKVGTSCVNTAKTGLTLTQKTTRATVLIPRTNAIYLSPWEITSGTAAGAPVDVEALNTYALIAIPSGATRIKLRMTNTNYYYGLLVHIESGFKYDSGWTLGGNDITYDVSSINGKIWIGSTIKNLADTDLSPVTLATLGWSAEIEYDE